MALVGQAALVAQFAGVDAYGLIKMIAEAALTVRRNRATCLQLARRAQMISDLLHQLHSAQLMQQPETRNPMEQLEETLRHALLLVRSCRSHGYLYRCFMGARHADELREVQGEITFYLQLFPLISYVDTTLTWVRLLNKAGSEPSCTEAPVVRPYLVPFLFVSTDEWCLDHKVPGSEAQLLAPLDHKVPGSHARLPVPSHDVALQVPGSLCCISYDFASRPSLIYSINKAFSRIEGELRSSNSLKSQL